MIDDFSSVRSDSYEEDMHWLNSEA